jgi:hypothetical protein
MAVIGLLLVLSVRRVCLLSCERLYIQGGSDMTGTICV